MEYSDIVRVISAGLLITTHKTLAHRLHHNPTRMRKILTLFRELRVPEDRLPIIAIGIGFQRELFMQVGIGLLQEMISWLFTNLSMVLPARHGADYEQLIHVGLECFDCGETIDYIIDDDAYKCFHCRAVFHDRASSDTAME